MLSKTKLCSNQQGPRIDPRLRLYLHLTNPSTNLDLSPEEERAEQQKVGLGLFRFFGSHDKVRLIEDIQIAADGRDIPVRIYNPTKLAEAPIIVFLHGGGWVLGNLAQVDSVCRRLSARAGHIVISVDYRLAPEHKFPAALEDTLAVLEWASKHASEMGGSKDRLGVAGGSAGATLATAATMIMREKCGTKIAFQVLFNPVTNLAYMDTESHILYGEKGYVITTALLRKRMKQYLRNIEEAYSPLVSPLLANEYARLPPALIVTAELDPLRDEAEAYGKMLSQGGIHVQCTRYLGVTHGFFNLLGILPQAENALEEASLFITKCCSNQ